MKWFWRLSSERHYGQVLGPIPYSKIEDRARRGPLGGNPALEELFCLVIENLDRAFLEWNRKEHDRHVRMRGRGKRRPPAGKSARGGRARSRSRG